MNGSSSVAQINQEYKDILLVGFIIYKSCNNKDLRTNIFEGGNFVMTQCNLLNPKT